MNKIITKILSLVLALSIIFGPLLITKSVYATNSETTHATTEIQPVDKSKSAKAIASGVAIGLAGLGGTIGMGMAIGKSSEGISRQPEAESKIRTTLMLGLVFIETVVIYALIVAILVIFVL